MPSHPMPVACRFCSLHHFLPTFSRPVTVRPPQACDRRAPSAVLRVRYAGARLAVDRFQAQQPHQPPHPVPTNPHPLARQVAHHLPAAVERLLQVQLVDAPHQRQRLRAQCDDH